MVPTRLVGSTDNPWWYAERLAMVPAAYRIVGCLELQQTAQVLARRMMSASESAD